MCQSWPGALLIETPGASVTLLIVGGEIEGECSFCQNSPMVSRRPVLPERVKWIRTCFHPCLLFFNSETNYFIFSTSGERLWAAKIEKIGMRDRRRGREEAQRQSFLEQVSHGDAGEEKISVQFCSLAPCTLHQGWKKIAWWNVFQPNIAPTARQ